MSNSDAIVGGYFIPKHSHVIVSRYGLGRNPRVWDEPLKFKPERHFKTHGDGSGTSTVDLAEPDLKYMSFGIGRRGCPGIQLGSLMSIMLLARLLQAFDWIPPDGQSMIDLSETADEHSMVKPLLAHAKPRLPLHVYAAAEM
ncbi:hypothetical protein MKW92_032042 [Papaver armeniacum]|nr:hypothetical protein MKW92_032042 [Papaver armeniacum]